MYQTIISIFSSISFHSQFQYSLFGFSFSYIFPMEFRFLPSPSGINHTYSIFFPIFGIYKLYFSSAPAFASYIVGLWSSVLSTKNRGKPRMDLSRFFVLVFWFSSAFVVKLWSNHSSATHKPLYFKAFSHMFSTRDACKTVHQLFRLTKMISVHRICRPHPRCDEHFDSAAIGAFKGTQQAGRWQRPLTGSARA